MLVGSFVGLLACWWVRLLVCYVGVFVCWFADMLVGSFVGLLVCWWVRLLVCYVGVFVCWFAGMLVGTFVYLSVYFVQLVNESRCYVVVAAESAVGEVSRLHRPRLERGAAVSKYIV